MTTKNYQQDELVERISTGERAKYVHSCKNCGTGAIEELVRIPDLLGEPSYAYLPASDCRPVEDFEQMFIDVCDELNAEHTTRSAIGVIDDMKFRLSAASDNPGRCDKCGYAFDGNDQRMVQEGDYDNPGKMLCPACALERQHAMEIADKDARIAELEQQSRDQYEDAGMPFFFKQRKEE